MKQRQKLQYPTELPAWKGLSFLPNGKGVRKIDKYFDEVKVDNTIEFLKYLKNNPHPNIVPVLNYHRLDDNEYTYDMPLMAELNKSEGQLVDLFAEGYDHPSYRIKNEKEVSSLKEKHPKLYQVINKISSWDVYGDLHKGNVMKDRYGNLRLIDIEGFSFTRFSAEEIIFQITARR